MHKRASEERDREEPELESPQARRGRRVLHREAALLVICEEGMASESRDVPCRRHASAEPETCHEMVDVGQGAMRLTPEEVEEDRERRPSDDREDLDEPVGREILRDRPSEAGLLIDRLAGDK